MWRQVTSLISSIYTFLIGAGNPLETCTLHLYTNDVDWSGPVVIGDITEAAFTGYAAAAVTYAAAVDADGNPYLNHAPAVFTCSGATGLPLQIKGAYVTTAGGLQFGAAAAAPITLSANGQVMHATLPYQLFPTTDDEAELFIM